MLKSALFQPLWATSLDEYNSPTSDEQVEVEATISELLAPYRRAKRPKRQEKDQDEAAVATPKEASFNAAAESKSQQSTATSALPIPSLNRRAHLNFLRKNLQPLPSTYVGYDSNRSWLLYWVLHGHDLLGSPWGDIQPQSFSEADPTGQSSESEGHSDRRRAVETLLSFQNKATGGFGGGVGQVAHLMATYAAVSALAIAGAPGYTRGTALKRGEKASGDAGAGWDEIDRIKLYNWLLSLKQPDGSFVVHHGGEVDVRASYCVLCISLLLGICTPELIDGMQDFITRCQTYEGGLAASAFTDAEYPDGGAFDISPPLGEAHGGYAHCALASYLTLLRLNDGLPTSSQEKRRSTPLKMNLDSCLRWAVSQQGLAIEGGAFRGRTNKLVDGCYGWFSGGGMFSVLDATLYVEGRRPKSCPTTPATRKSGTSSDVPEANSSSASSDSSSAWTSASSDDQGFEDGASVPPTDSFLYDRTSLQEYILVAAQVKTGGLRDKPGKRPDAYHTCYNLSGLSLAQHRLLPCQSSMKSFKESWRSVLPSTTENGSENMEEAEKQREEAKKASAWRAHCYAATLSWREDASQMYAVGGSENLVTPTHPVLNITFIRAKRMMDYFYGQE